MIFSKDATDSTKSIAAPILNEWPVNRALLSCNEVLASNLSNIIHREPGFSFGPTLPSLQSLRTDAFRYRRESFETIDRLIERQLKNVRLLMQSYDSVRFAPQVHKKMALEIEQLELQVRQSREDQRLEVDRQ